MRGKFTNLVKKSRFAVAVLVAVVVSFAAASCLPLPPNTTHTVYSLNSDIQGGSYTLLGNPGWKKNIHVIIPAEYNDKPVTRISDKAFSDFTNLQTVTIPNSIKRIGARAFEGCTALKNIIIPESVTHIGQYAFRKCTALEAVKLFANVTLIDYMVFDGCSKLEWFIIPDSIEQISAGAFRNCTKLKNFYILRTVDIVSINTQAFQNTHQDLKIKVEYEFIGGTNTQLIDEYKRLHTELKDQFDTMYPDDRQFIRDQGFDFW